MDKKYGSKNMDQKIWIKKYGSKNMDQKIWIKNMDKNMDKKIWIKKNGKTFSFWKTWELRWAGNFGSSWDHLIGHGETPMDFRGELGAEWRFGG